MKFWLDSGRTRGYDANSDWEKMNNITLFLDDDYNRYILMKMKYPDYCIVWVQTMDAMMQVIDSDPFSISRICLDHDLGYLVADDRSFHWVDSMTTIGKLNKQKKNLSHVSFIIHSGNPVGSKNLYDAIRNMGLNATLDPKYYIIVDED